MGRIKKVMLRFVLAVIVFQVVLVSAGPFGAKVLAECMGGQRIENNLGYPVYHASYNRARVGGISLDQAATFMQDMSDITGAYFDQATNRVVFVGKKNTTQTPVFNKDDFAVAVRALIFNNTIPAVSIGNNWTGGAGPMNVNFSGNLENTNFGYVLQEADYKLKQYFLGYDPSLQPITSSVTGYKSAAQRVLDQHPGNYSGGASRFQIDPELITLKKDDNAGSFIFDQVKMRVQQEPLSTNNSAIWNQAVAAWAQNMTDYYDSYAQEIPTWQRTKELAKLVSVIKWLKDNNVATDYGWAKNYTPAQVATASSFPAIITPNVTQDGYTYHFEGGIAYGTSNSYVSDNGASSSLKSASQSAASSPEANHWEFTQNNQNYVSVSVAANAFRSIGGYTTGATDMGFNVQGEIDLAFTRTYSSFSAGQKNIGRGWDWTPAQLTNLQPWNSTSCSPQGGYSGLYPAKIAFQAQDGTYETFTYDCGSGYVPDQTYYHTKLTRNTDGSYTVTLKNQQYYKFGIGMALLMHRDKNNNGLLYHYDNPANTNITRISDLNGHELTLTYNSNNLISSVKDWTNRTVSYGYNSNGDLTTVTDPRNNVITYGYDSSDRLTNITDRLNHQVFATAYNDKSKMTSSTSSSGLVTNYTYDETNRLATATDANQRVSKTYYDARGRVTQLVDPLNNSQTYTYGSEMAPLTVTDKRNNTTTYTYDSNGNTTSVTYPNNKQVTYQYNTQNFVTQVSDGRYGVSPKVTAFTYDTPGNVLSKDEAGLTTAYTYSAQGDVTAISSGLSQTTSFTWGSFGNKLSETTSIGGTTSFTYDSLARPTQVTDATGKTKNYTYDANNNVLTETDSVGTKTNIYSAENVLTKSTLPDSSVVEYAFNNSGSQTSTKDAATNLTSYGYDDYQNLTSRQDALSHTTQYVYDKLNRKTESTTPLGKVAKWEYDANGNISKRIDESNRETTYSYNVLNWLTTITYPDSSTATYTYDDRGNPTQITGPAGTTNLVYDTHNRMTSATDPHNDAVTYSYDAAHNLTSITYPGNKVVNYKYNSGNQLKSVSDWNGSKTYYAYNPNGTLQSKLLPNGLFAEYGYDSANRLSSLQYLKDQSLVTRFSYARNTLGNVTTETESKPATLSTYSTYEEGLPTGWSTGWSWNGTVTPNDTTAPYAGTKAMGWKINSAWAGLHLRSTGATVSTGSYAAVTFAIKGGSLAGQPMEVVLKDANDNDLSTAVDLAHYGGYPNDQGYKVYTIPLAAFNAVNTSVSAIVFQDLSGVAQPKVFIDSIGFTTAPAVPLTMYKDGIPPNYNFWTWNVSASLADTTQPFDGTNSVGVTNTSGWGGVQFHSADGFTTKGYDYLRFALKGSQPNQNFTIQMTSSTGAGLVAEKSIIGYAGRPDGNDYTIYTIPLADLGAQNTTSHGVILQSQTGSAEPKVLWDDVKLVPSATTNVTNQQATFTYDSVGRVLSATYPYGTYGYTYDAAGNLLTSNENGTQSTHTVNNDNQVTAKASRSFTYDNQGNRITDGSKTLTYDFDDRLKSFADPSGSTVNFLYDALGNRIEKNITSGSSYRFVNDLAGELSKVLVSKNTTANTSVYYLYGNELISQGDSASNTRDYYLNDGLGNVRYVSNSSGGNIQTYSYDPYGNQVAGSGSNFNFQQQQKDTESGLFYLRARYYDPTTGRFTSRDPVEGTFANPQSQNGYSYANGDPINLTDPSGEFAIVPLIWAVGAGLAAWTAHDVYQDVKSCNYDQAALAALGFLPIGRVGSKALPLLDRSLVWMLGNRAANIGGRHYTSHALNQMQNVGIVPSAVENVIKWGKEVPSSSPTTIKKYDAVNNLSVSYAKDTGNVVTVHYGQ
jgi:RHS repeat-associated protein